MGKTWVQVIILGLIIVTGLFGFNRHLKNQPPKSTPATGLVQQSELGELDNPMVSNFTYKNK